MHRKFAPARKPYKSSASKKFGNRRWIGYLSDYWLFSSEELPLKIGLLVFLLLVAILVVLTTVSLHTHTARDVAYSQILHAAGAADYLGVMTGAEAFLSNRSWLQDNREQQVRDLYDEALVRWFMQQGSQLDPLSLTHIERYRTLTGTSGQ